MADHAAELLQVDAACLGEPHRFTCGSVADEGQHVARQLHSRTGAGITRMNDHGRKLLEGGLDALIDLAVRTDHHRQFTLLGSHTATGYRGVHDVDVARLQFRRQLDGRFRADRGMNGDHGARLGVGGEFTDHLPHLSVVEHRHADDVGDRDVGDAIGKGGAGFGQWRHRLGAHVEHHDPTGPVDEALGHRRPHVAESDVAELGALRLAHDVSFGW